ncbi:MAG: M20/M25/M40 family metallo-hydrolase [Sulfitobacter sp.]
MAQMLAKLIACDTCFPPGSSYQEFSDLVELLFAPLGGSSERVEVPAELWQAPNVTGRRVNLILRPDIGPADAPEALIYFHTDTAPIGDGWTRPALELSVEGARLYGRGAADMKGTIVSVFEALMRLRDRGAALAYRPVLAFCTDEEGGIYPGIRYLAETTKLPEILLNLNGSAEPRIWAGCLGSLDLELHLQGRTAHSGTPEKGINAVAASAEVLVALKEFGQQLQARHTAMPPPPWAEGPLSAQLSVTAIHGGDKGSAIPGSCRVTINRRYLPEENPATVIAEIKTLLDGVLKETPLVGWDLSEVGHLPPVSDPDGPATDRWTQARAVAFDLPPSDFTRYGSGTSSDFGWVQQAGIQHMLLGGLSRPDRNVHAANEFTTFDDLIALSNAIENFFDATFHHDDPKGPKSPTFA